MSDSIGKIFLECECAELVKLNYPVDNLRLWAECVESGADRPVAAGARAVALHVLEIACPGSPILAAMKAGASFEEAVERDPERIRRAAWCMTCNGGHYPPGVICPTCSGSGVDPAKMPQKAAPVREVEPTGRDAPPTAWPMHRCAGKSCPGLPWKASEHPHPGSCVGIDPTEAPLSVRLAQQDKDASRAAMRRAAERIDEPTEAEFAAAVGEIFGGLAAPTARSGS